MVIKRMVQIKHLLVRIRMQVKEIDKGNKVEDPIQTRMLIQILTDNLNHRKHERQIKEDLTLRKDKLHDQIIHQKVHDRIIRKGKSQPQLKVQILNKVQSKISLKAHDRIKVHEITVVAITSRQIQQERLRPKASSMR